MLTRKMISPHLVNTSMSVFIKLLITIIALSLLCALDASADPDLNIVWQDDTYGNNEILFKKSTDGGVIWPPATRVTNNTGNSQNPVMVVDGATIYLAWQDDTHGTNEILFKKSTDGGITWPSATRVTNNTGNSQNPVIVVDGATIYLAWQDDTYGNNEILFKKSTDGGVTWPAATRVTNNAGNSQNPVIVVDGATIYLVWQDDTYGNNEILFKKSTGGGITWPSATRVTNNTGNSQNPVMAVDGPTIYLAWQDDTYGNNEILFKKSSDGGVTWPSATRVTNNAGNSQNPLMVVDGATIYLAWQDDRYGNSEIMFTKSLDGGSTWESSATRVTNNSGHSQNPTMAVDGADVYLGWQDDTHGNNELLFKKSMDGGVTWPSATRVTNNAGSSQLPAMILRKSSISAPTVTISSPQPGPTNVSSPQLLFTSSSGTAAVMVDGVEVQKTSGENLDPLPDGLHTIRIVAVDAMGYSGFAETRFAIITVPPVVTINSPAGLINDKTPQILYTASTGIVTIEVDDIVVQKLSGDRLDALADGEHLLRVESVDPVGNVGAAEIVFAVDTVPPLAGGFIRLAAGIDHTIGLTSDGTLWGQGNNGYGQLGNGTRVDSSSLRLTGRPDTWTTLAAGSGCSLAVKTDGTLWNWGDCALNEHEGWELGLTRPKQIGTDSNWKNAYSAQGYWVNNNFAIKTPGTLWAWGYNDWGQLGNGSQESVLVPTQIGSDADWRAIAGGEYHTLGLKSDGRLWAWGYNWGGQVGVGGSEHIYLTPVLVGDGWSAVAAGYYHSMGIKFDGTLWAWGYNYPGPLGDGTYTDRWEPLRIGNDSNWAAVAAGEMFTFALKSNGTLWSWGDNQNGQLGTGGGSWQELSPVQIGTDSDWVAISAGGQHAIALKRDGTLWSWGYDRTIFIMGEGEGGPISSYGSSYTPVMIGLVGKVAINNGAAYTHSLNANLTLIASDANGVSEMQFSRDGAAWSVPEAYATERTWTLDSGDGRKTIYVKFKDIAGNWSSIYSASIVVDTVPPTIAIQSPAAGLTYTTSPTLTFAKSDGSAVVFVDGVQMDIASGAVLDMLSDNAHTVRVEVTDASGLKSAATVTFTTDVLSPIVSISSPVAEKTKDSTPALIYSVSDGEITVKVDDGVVNKPSESSLDTLNDGQHTVTVESRDIYSRVSSTTVSFEVDTVAPTVSISLPVSGMTYSTSPIVDYSVSDGSIVVKVDGNTVSNVSPPVQLNALPNGSHTVHVYATDTAGNVGAAQVTFTINNTSGVVVDPDATNVYCNGTENYLVGPSNFTSDINVPTTGNAVWIASPHGGATISGPKTIVKGAMDTTVPVKNVMVVVSNSTGTVGYAAQVNGKYFAAKVSIIAGNNSIAVIATDQNNVQHQAIVSGIYVNMPSVNVDLIAVPSAGIPILKQQNGQTTLDVALGATASIQKKVASYSWDFSGSGSDDLTCYSHSNVSASYVQTGLYLTQVAVTDAEGTRYTDSSIVNVLDRAEVDNIFKAIWNGMKVELGRQDVEGAVAYFNEGAQARYRAIFSTLIAGLPELVRNMQDIQLVYANDMVVKYRIRKDELYGGNMMTITYYIYFTKDTSGAWTIEKF